MGRERSGRTGLQGMISVHFGACGALQKIPAPHCAAGQGAGSFFFTPPLALFLWFPGPRFCFPPLNHRSGALFFAGHRLRPSSL